MRKAVFLGLLVILLAFGFIGCDDSDGDNEETFTSSTNETISNDINSLGLVGTSVSSSNVNIATAVITSGKIKITSVGQGSAVITVIENSKNAIINVSVSKTGIITIESIVKYDTTGEENIQLPEPVGINELSGKTYDSGFFIINFSSDNSYSLSSRLEDNTPFIFETGFYSWNSSQKTVIVAVDKYNLGFGLKNKIEIEEDLFGIYSSLPPEELELTIEQYIDIYLQSVFLSTTYSYVIEGGLIKYFGVKVTLPDTGTTIAGCAYSQKASTDAFGTHYLLSISFDNALSILISTYGQPEEGEWAWQSDSILTTGADWVILEYTRYNDFRLTKSVSGETTTKGWKVNLPFVGTWSGSIIALVGNTDPTDGTFSITFGENTFDNEISIENGFVLQQKGTYTYTDTSVTGTVMEINITFNNNSSGWISSGEIFEGNKIPINGTLSNGQLIIHLNNEAFLNDAMLIRSN